MGILKYASFAVLASAIADADGALPADVLRVGDSGSAFHKRAHRHEFAYDPKPGYLYVRSRAISSRTNDNFDTFPAHAIKEAWSTFIGKPVFVNHHNADHRRMRGLIIDAALHEDRNPDGSPDTWVEVLMEVDAVRFPKLAQAVVQGHIDRTSMGTEVAKATCSYCGNVATNPAEYCRHIPAMKGQRITRRTASGTQESVLVSEICEGLHFFENSLLVEPPADPTAFTFGVDTRGLGNDPATASMVRSAALREVLAEADVVPLKDKRTCSEPGCTRKRAPGSTQCHSHRWEDERPILDDLTDEDIFLAASLLEREAAMTDDLTEAEFLQAEAVMCSECNPSLAGITSGLCSPHAYQAKQRAEFGLSAADFGTAITGSQHVAEDGAMNYGAPKAENLGRCYELSAKRVAFGPDHAPAFNGYKDAHLIHGTIQSPLHRDLPPLEHGWVEEPDGNVWEPATDTVYNKHVFKALFQPKERVRYSAKEARAKMVEHQHFGPWDRPSDLAAVSMRIEAAAQGLPKHTYSVTFPDGKKATRTTTRDYSHVVLVNTDTAHNSDDYHAGKGWLYRSWHGDEHKARKARDEASRDYAETHIAAVDNPRPASHYESATGKDAPVGAAKCPRSGTSVTGQDERGRSWSSQFDVICPDCGEWVPNRKGKYGSHKPAKKASRHTAYGEQVAPAEVDTLRADNCPVCGDPNSFNGAQCRICGFIQPPDLFNDPDLERAKQVDLRGGDATDTDQTQTSQLVCPECSATFPGQPQANNGEAPNPFQTTSAIPSDAVPTANADAATEDEDDQEDKQHKVDEDKGREDKQQAMKAGDTCPQCGQGALEPVAPSGANSGDQSQSPAAQQADPQAPQGADEHGAHQPEHVDPDTPGNEPGIKPDPHKVADPGDEDSDATQPDHQQPPAVHQQPQQAPAGHGAPPAPHGGDKTPTSDDKDSDEDEDHGKDDKKKKSLPPWMNKGKTSSHGAWSQSKESVDMTNPAQQGRNRIIEALRSQQEMISTQANLIETQGEQIGALRGAFATLAHAAGIANHPRFASLISEADLPADDKKALAPAAKDSPENIGAAPSSANTGVTPEATTDVNNDNVAVAAEPFNNLTDVTKAETDVQPPKGDAAHVDTDVKVGNPSNEPFPNNSGWTTGAKEDPQVRLMASLRLAKLRKSAGISDGDDLVNGQAIADDRNLALAAIQHEINTLTQVVEKTASAPAQQREARRLVPQRAQATEGVQRTVPSLTSQASGGVQQNGSESGVDLSESFGW